MHKGSKINDIIIIIISFQYLLVSSISSRQKKSTHLKSPHSPLTLKTKFQNRTGLKNCIKF